MSEAISQADVVVVGAGPAGSTAAAILARRGWRVLLVDRATFPRDKTCGDGLTPRAMPVLDQLGLLPTLEARGCQVVGGAHVFASDGTEWRLRFADYALGLPPFGMVIPRYELDHLLCQYACAQGARFLAGLHVTGPIRRGDAVAGIQGTTGGQLVSALAPLTILTTGANIGLLRAFGLLKTMPPGINAIRGYFTGVPGLSDEFEFYFDAALAHGYGWVFPVDGERANIGVGVLARDADKSEARDLRRCLVEFISRHPRLRAARPCSPAESYPLRIDFPSCRPAGAGFLLAGEALGLVNPVTGEGIDLALESAELAADAADTALRKGDASAGAFTAYSRALHCRYAGSFRGNRLLRHLATSPKAINILTRQALRKPYLASVIAGISLGMVSPYTAFTPRVWWNILT